MSASASKPAKPLSDFMVVALASERAIDRIDRAQRDGKHARNAAKAAKRRIYDIPLDVGQRGLSPADAALEMLRIEITLKRRAPKPAAPKAPKAPAAVAEVPSGEEWEPGDPILHPYDPNPPVIVPLDIDYTAEDWAAIRKAREARNA